MTDAAGVSSEAAEESLWSRISERTSVAGVVIATLRMKLEEEVTSCAVTDGTVRRMAIICGRKPTCADPVAEFRKRATCSDVAREA
jgi:hypothetical protein